MSDIPAPKTRRKIIYPSQERLRELFDYHEDGYLIWKLRPRADFASHWAWKVWNKKHPGHRVGHISKKDGYTRFSIGGSFYTAHVLIWIWHFGEIENGYEIDHREGHLIGDMIENLQKVTHAINSKNARIKTNNKSGYSGVYWNKKRKKWYASVCVDYKPKFLGAYDDPAAAGNAVRIFYNENGFTERHGT